MTPYAWVIIHAVAAVAVIAVLVRRGVLRSRSLISRGVRDVMVHPVWLWLGCAFMIFAVQAVSAGIAGASYQIDPALMSDAGAAGVLALAAYGIGAVVALLLVRLVASSAPAAGLRVTGRAPAVGAGCFLLAWPVVAVVGMAARWAAGQLGQDISDDLAHPTLRLVTENPRDPWVWVLIACAVFGAPLVEEITYRAFVQSAVLRLTGRPGVSVACAAAVFAAVHLGSGIPWYALAPIGVLGLAMGLAFERTKSLGVPIVMHVLFNAANVVLALVLGGS